MKSMKMAVVCANGKAGRLIVEKAVERGIEVTQLSEGKTEARPKTLSRRTYSPWFRKIWRASMRLLTPSAHGLRKHCRSTARP